MPCWHIKRHTAAHARYMHAGGRGMHAQICKQGVCSHSPPLTTPSPATAGAPPSPLHAIAVHDACCDAMQGTQRNAGGACAEGRTDWQDQGVIYKHASEHHSLPLLRPPVPPNTLLRTNWHQTTPTGRTVRYLKAGDTLPECTIWQATDYRRSPCKMLSPAHIALCPNAMLPYKFGYPGNRGSTCAIWLWQAAVHNNCLGQSTTHTLAKQALGCTTPLSLHHMSLSLHHIIWSTCH